MKHAVRSLLRSPGHTIVALLTLALGIGVNTSMVSGVQALLFRPGPFPASERIARIIGLTPQGKMDQFSFTELEEIRARTTAFDTLATLGWDFTMFAESGRANRSRMISMTMSSPTSRPASMTCFAFSPNSVPSFTAARSMSPVEMWGTT